MRGLRPAIKVTWSFSAGLDPVHGKWRPAATTWDIFGKNLFQFVDDLLMSLHIWLDLRIFLLKMWQRHLLAICLFLGKLQRAANDGLCRWTDRHIPLGAADKLMHKAAHLAATVSICRLTIFVQNSPTSLLAATRRFCNFIAKKWRNKFV